MSLFVCPICGAALEREPGRYRCPAGHSYDVAREGYTHLLPANRKHSKMPGDDKGMAAARSVFSQQGLLRRPAGCPVPSGTGLCPGASGGAGHRLRRGILHQPPSTGRCGTPGRRPCMAGTDISKAILRRAAKREKRRGVRRGLLLPPAGGGRDRIDLLLNCFSPLALEEFRRVAPARRARFSMWCPSAKHLWELKQVLYDRPYPNEVKETPYEGFAYAEIRHVEDRIRVLGRRTSTPCSR